MAKIDALLKVLAEENASDLHMVPGDTPIFRINGLLRRTSLERLTSEKNKKYFYEIMDTSQIESFEKFNDVDLSYEIKGVARFRCNMFLQNNGVSGVFRIIPSTVLSVDQLMVPQSVRDFTRLKNGLILMTGPTGSGKSTTLASLIDLINSTKGAHIITIEDPLEFVHEEKMSIVTHREVGIHTGSFANALRAAMREDPDVIMVGEMRDLETISLALAAAEMGVLVFGTLHTNSAPKTINRIIDVFPDIQQEQIRTMLASCLKGVVAQQLLKKMDGSGRVAAMEVLVVNSGISNLIREGKSYQILSMMQTSLKEGNCTMDQALTKLFHDQQISALEAWRKATNKKLFENLLPDENEFLGDGETFENVSEVLNIEISETVADKQQMGKFVESLMDEPDKQKTDRKMRIAGKSDTLISTPQIHEPKQLPFDQFHGAMGDEINRSKRYGHKVSLIIAELDGLVDWLSSSGRQKDEIIANLMGAIRSTDTFTEVNDQVFLVFCPETDESVDVVTKGIFDVFSNYFKDINSVSVKTGDSTYPSDADGVDEMIETASNVKYY